MTTQLISGGSDIGPENRPGASILELALKYSQTLRSYKGRGYKPMVKNDCI